jgi:hypothetical protein
MTLNKNQYRLLRIFRRPRDHADSQGGIGHGQRGNRIHVECHIHELSVALAMGKLVHISRDGGDRGVLADRQAEVG